MSGFYPEFEDSREVQLGSLAAIGFLLQIRDLLGDIDRFERSVRFKFSRSVWFKFFLETEKVQIQMFLGEKKPNLIWQLLLIKSGLLRVPNFRCGTGLTQTHSTPESWNPKMCGICKGRVCNYKGRFFTTFLVPGNFLDTFVTNFENFLRSVRFKVWIEPTGKIWIERTVRTDRIGPIGLFICKESAISAKETSWAFSEGKNGEICGIILHVCEVAKINFANVQNLQ